MRTSHSGSFEDCTKVLSLEHGLPAGHLRLHHVRSQAGDPYNEFVDLMAKREAHQSFHHGRPPLNMQKWNLIIPHLWLTFAQPCGLPAWTNGVLATDPPDLPAQDRHATSDENRADNLKHFDCTLSLASANVMSLSRRPDGCSGKLHFLFAQMKQFGLNAMGIQEGRADECMTTSCDILRLTGGHSNRNGGVELWINLKQPIAHSRDGDAVYFAKDQFQVVYSDPRRLLVKANRFLLTCWFFVGHGPHSGRPQDERTTWWHHTNDLLAEHLDEAPCFWLLDTNAAPGAADNNVVYQPGLNTSVNTACFRESLDKFAMCLPCTTCLHYGSRHTWTSIDGSTLHCIDYVAVPSTWLSSCVWSQVIEDFDLATTRDDHQVVGLELRWEIVATHKRSPRQPANTKWSCPEQRERARGRLAEIEVPSWKTDIEIHELEVRKQLQKAIQVEGKPTKSRPKKVYIDSETWSIRTQLLQHGVFSKRSCS